jgi:mannose-6-phosphate isomerase-like protein (cupin superfamily)
MTREAGPFDLASTFVRLRSDAPAEPLPVDESFWERLAAGELGSFHNEYLVLCHSFDADWPTWERHPNGDEIVCLLSGSVRFILERDGGNEEIELNDTGAFVLVPKGTWHTARANAPSQMLFITAGEGTETREA